MQWKTVLRVFLTLNKKILQWNFKLDIKMCFSCHSHDVGKFARQSGGLVQVINGQDLEARGPNHHLSLIDVGPLNVANCFK